MRGRLRACISFAVVGLVVVAVAGCGGNSDSQTKILFSDVVDGTQRLVAVRPDARPLRDVFAKPQNDGAPIWSPDGDAIAFVLNGELVVTDEDGGNAKSVLALVLDEVWAWSPDSEHITYVYEDLGVVSADGSDARTLVRCRSDLCSVAAWSPDGKRLAYGLGSRLEVVDLQGAKRVLVRCVLSGCVQPRCPECLIAAWSPDGEWIAFAAQNRFGCGLSVVRSDGEQLDVIVQPLESPGSCASVRWSPDGKLLALGRVRPDAVAVFRQDDRNWQLVRQINDADAFNAAWSPDGRHFAYIDDPSSVLWIASANGEQQKRLGHAYGFDWSPDSTALVALHPLENSSSDDTPQYGPPFAIWFVDVATAQHRQIYPANGSCDCSDPRWQPR